MSALVPAAIQGRVRSVWGPTAISRPPDFRARDGPPSGTRSERVAREALSLRALRERATEPRCMGCAARRRAIRALRARRACFRSPSFALERDGSPRRTRGDARISCVRPGWYQAGRRAEREECRTLDIHQLRRVFGSGEAGTVPDSSPSQELPPRTRPPRSAPTSTWRTCAARSRGSSVAERVSARPLEPGPSCAGRPDRLRSFAVASGYGGRSTRFRAARGRVAVPGPTPAPPNPAPRRPAAQPQAPHGTFWSQTPQARRERPAWRGRRAMRRPRGAWYRPSITRVQRREGVRLLGRGSRDLQPQLR